MKIKGSGRICTETVYILTNRQMGTNTDHHAVNDNQNYSEMVVSKMISLNSTRAP